MNGRNIESKTWWSRRPTEITDHDAENTADADLEDPTEGEAIVC